MGETVTPARRPGGRSARVRDDVYSAVGRLIGQGHQETLAVPQIAPEAGVNPTSVYRRWGSVEALCAEVAVVERPARAVHLRALASSRTGRLAWCPCWDQRVAQAALMTTRARERAEATPRARQVVDHVVAPLYHDAVFALPGGRRYARTLVGDVLAMVG